MSKFIKINNCSVELYKDNKGRVADITISMDKKSTISGLESLGRGKIDNEFNTIDYEIKVTNLFEATIRINNWN